MLTLPKIFIGNSQRHSCIASAGYCLDSLQAASRSLSPETVASEIHAGSVRILQWLARCPAKTLCLELHYIGRPSFDTRVRPTVSLGLRLQAKARTQKQAIAICLQHLPVFDSIIRHCWPQADFRPLTAAEDYQELFHPFTAQSCLALERRRAWLDLTHPFIEQRKDAPPLGFSPTSRQFSSKPFSVFHCYPWQSVPETWTMLLVALLRHPVPVQLIVRFVPTQQPRKVLERLQQILASCEHALARTDSLPLTEQLHHLRSITQHRLADLTQSALLSNVLLLFPGSESLPLANLVGSVLSPYRPPSQLPPGLHSSPLWGGFAIRPLSASRASKPFAALDDEPFTIEEASCCFRIPVIYSSQNFGLPVRRAALLPADVPNFESNSGFFHVATNIFQHQAREVRVPIEHRFKHTFVLGMTGTGKSTYLLHSLLQDVQAGFGICLIDPHGELADKLLERYPENRHDDLILIDLADYEHPVPLNFLRWKTLQQKQIIVDTIYSTLDRIYDFRHTGGPIFEENFRATLHLLMGPSPNREPHFTLLEVPEFYQNEDFREALVERAEDELLRGFVRRLERANRDFALNELAPYVVSKFNRFLFDHHLRRIVGHGDLKIDFEQVLNERKVLLVKLGSGRFGPQTAELFTGLFLAQLRAAVMSRATLPEEARNPFFLYIDELGTLAFDPTLPLLLSEARKYKVGLILATQYLAQIRAAEAHQDVLSAVFGNVATFVSFRVGPLDAQILDSIFAPAVSESDLIQLPNFEGYIRLHLDLQACQPFSFYVDKPLPGDARRREQLSQRSHEKWSCTPQEVEDQIQERRRWVESL